MLSIYQHFRPEEREFIDQVVEWKRVVEDTYAPKLTDFLDPREQHIVRSVAGGQEGVAVSFFGGIINAERQRALIYPDYFLPEATDYDLTLYEINYPQKFIAMEHPQILGSVMSLGIRRGKFGDIVSEEGRFQLVVAHEVAAYMEMNLQQIGKAAVSLEQKSFQEALTLNEEWRELEVTVSSLRLDSIIASYSKQSRAKVQTFIKGGLVKVNWRITEDPALECSSGDVISVRGIGRSKLLGIEGKTKKEKWRVKLGILK